MKFIIYSAKECGYCDVAKKKILSVGGRYTEYDVVRMPEKAEELFQMELVNLPQIWWVPHHGESQYLGSYPELEEFLRLRNKGSI